MARKTDDKKKPYEYPSRFGTHASMVELEETKSLKDDNLVVCKDEHGLYVTNRRNVDSGLADPFRHMWPKARAEKFAEITGKAVVYETNEEEKD